MMRRGAKAVVGAALTLLLLCCLAWERAPQVLAIGGGDGSTSLLDHALDHAIVLDGVEFSAGALLDGNDPSCSIRRVAATPQSSLTHADCASACTAYNATSGSVVVRCVAISFVAWKSELASVNSDAVPLQRKPSQAQRKGTCALLLCNGTLLGRTFVLGEVAARVAIATLRWQRPRQQLSVVHVLPRSTLFGVVQEWARSYHHRRHKNSIHFLCLSSRQYFTSRLIPALRTWMQHQRVAVFLDEIGDGLEPHQRDVGAASASAEPDLAVAALLTEAARHSVYLDLVNVTVLSDMAPQRKSINGAWKPLALLSLMRAGLASALRAKSSDTKWFVVVDDDVFVVVPNLLLHLERHEQGKSPLVVVRTEANAPRAMIVGVTEVFQRVMEQPEYASIARTTNCTTRHNLGMHRVRYVQGGGGIAISARALQELGECVEQLGIAGSSGVRRVSLPNVTFDVFAATPAADAAHSVVGFVASGFADWWPAGDMRFAWAWQQCRSCAGTKSFSTDLIDDTSFSHRSVEMSVGADRRHWFAGFPATFHKLRQPHDFRKYHFATAASRISPLSSWIDVEDRLRRWWDDHGAPESAHFHFFGDHS